MRDDVTLFPMAFEHVPQVAALERANFSDPWSAAALEECLLDPMASFLVAMRSDGTVVGYAGLHVVLDEGYIDNICVREDYRGQGIADELLEVFVRFGRAKLAFLTLEVRLTNAPAIELYMKHGFAQVGRRKDYYEKPKEDALIMTLEFGDEKNGTDPISEADPA